MRRTHAERVVPAADPLRLNAADDGLVSRLRQAAVEEQVTRIVTRVLVAVDDAVRLADASFEILVPVGVNDVGINTRSQRHDLAAVL